MLSSNVLNGSVHKCPAVLDLFVPSYGTEAKLINRSSVNCVDSVPVKQIGSFTGS